MPDVFDSLSEPDNADLDIGEAWGGGDFNENAYAHAGNGEWGIGDIPGYSDAQRAGDAQGAAAAAVAEARYVQATGLHQNGQPADAAYLSGVNRVVADADAQAASSPAQRAANDAAAAAITDPRNPNAVAARAAVAKEQGRDTTNYRNDWGALGATNIVNTALGTHYVASGTDKKLTDEIPSLDDVKKWLENLGATAKWVAVGIAAFVVFVQFSKLEK